MIIFKVEVVSITGCKLPSLFLLCLRTDYSEIPSRLEVSRNLSTMKNCELCNELARIYCESDHADLCWDCDLKVHSANFLVAKHLRTLLCNVCQSPTAWSAAGVKIGRTISVCEKCVNEEGNNRQEEEEEEIDLEDFQVVPWSSTSPPPPASFSSSDQSLTEIFSLKRMHEDV